MEAKILSKPIFQHFCAHTRQIEPMTWKPSDLLGFQVPSVMPKIQPFLPCLAGFCLKCAELWVLPVKAAA